ncbi:ATP-binding protein [Fodinisporobacter ferrooxydans]|uniref:ATP-binding protein n=1 Tax=Fodinisporobacter ferrooxydans TaxID=2901836 RepID=A0ABY4CR56_9BACL|nr:ATP-binding protein [Alicyclobacillaceae bacterium MYW30-H2]
MEQIKIVRVNEMLGQYVDRPVYIGMVLKRYDKELENESNHIVVALTAFIVSTQLGWSPWTDPIDFDYKDFRIVRYLTTAQSLLKMLDLWCESKSYRDELGIDLWHPDKELRWWDEITVSPGSPISERVNGLPCKVLRTRTKTKGERLEVVPLVAENLPYFPDLQVAHDILIIGETSYLRKGLIPGTELFILDDTPRISKIHICSEETTIRIDGVFQAIHLELKIYGNNGFWHSQSVHEPGDYHVSWTGIPDEVIWVLTHGSEVLQMEQFHIGHQSERGRVTVLSTTASIEAWVESGEGQNVEFKENLNKKDNKEFVESVSAFTNTNDGVILVGVSDSGKIHGISKEPELESKITNYSGPQKLNNSEGTD